MSFILRLQNLPWSANAMDIRNFFKGLGIPDGGVHIVGGEIGDAFIAFSNDEDARQAMLRDGGKIKEIQVRLLLSSRTEMQKVIDTARLATAQYATLGKNSTAAATPASVHIVVPAQIQPPVITSNLTGLVAKQVGVLQNHATVTALSSQTLMQLKQQQTKLNALLMSNDASNDNKTDDRSSSEKDRKRDSDRRDRGYRSPRSRSRERSKRSRTRSRSRDRLGRTRRRRSRSRERRNRHRGSSSRERSRSRERSSRETKKELPNPWAVNPNPATANPIPIANDPLKTQKVEDFRNSSAFQGNTGLLLPDNAPLFTTSSSLNKPLIVTNNFVSTTYDQKVAQNEKIEGRCVKVSKMDRITGYGEIRRFFSGLQIHQNGIKMINDKTGRRTGVAYIRFARLEFKKLAVLQSGLNLRDAKVEVSTIPDDDFDEAVDSFKPRYDSYRRGGSYRSDDDDDDRDSDDDYYRKDRDRSRSRSRERERNRNRSTNRDDSDDDDLQIISNTSRDNNSDNDEDEVKLVSDSSKDSFTTLLIKDIPPFTKEQDIIKMFSNYTLVHILICKNVDGTKANYAYAKFHRAEDAKSALNENACHLIAYRNVTVCRVSDDIYDKDKNEINSDINLLDSELQSSTAKQQTNIIVSNNNINSKDEENEEQFESNMEPNKLQAPLDPRLQKAQITQNSYLMNQFDNSINNVWGPNATPTTSSVWQMNMGNGGNSFMNGNSNDSSVYQPRKDPRLSRFDNANAAPTPPVQPWSNPTDINPLNNFTNILSNNNNNMPLIRDPRQRNMGTNLYNNAQSPPTMDENNFAVQNYSLQSNVLNTCVVISNVELQTTERDIIDFFSEVGLIPQRIHFISNTNGLPIGDCFCEFSAPEEARRALQKNNYHLGMTSVKIELIASDKMEDILSSFQHDSMGIRNDPRNNNNYNNNNNNNNNSNSSNSNNSNNYRDRGVNDNFRDRMNSNNNNPNNNNNNNNNMNMNNNYRGNNGNFRGANNNNNMGRGFRGNNPMNRMNNNNKNNNNNNNMNLFNNGGNNNNNSNSKPPSLLSLPTPPLNIAGPAFNNNNNGPGNSNSSEFGKIGCVVSMENVPYRAGVDDILDFFNGFILDKQNIMRRYNDNGTPTGDARVCFLTPAEANRAMEIKKYGKIFNRTIYLKLLDDM